MIALHNPQLESEIRAELSGKKKRFRSGKKLRLFRGLLQALLYLFPIGLPIGMLSKIDKSAGVELVFSGWMLGAFILSSLWSSSIFQKVFESPDSERLTYFPAETESIVDWTIKEWMANWTSYALINSVFFAIFGTAQSSGLIILPLSIMAGILMATVQMALGLLIASNFRPESWIFWGFRWAYIGIQMSLWSVWAAVWFGDSALTSFIAAFQWAGLLVPTGWIGWIFAVIVSPSPDFFLIIGLTGASLALIAVGLASRQRLRDQLVSFADQREIHDVERIPGFLFQLEEDWDEHHQEITDHDYFRSYLRATERIEDNERDEHAIETTRQTISSGEFLEDPTPAPKGWIEKLCKASLDSDDLRAFEIFFGEWPTWSTGWLRGTGLVLAIVFVTQLLVFVFPAKAEDFHVFATIALFFPVFLVGLLPVHADRGRGFGRATGSAIHSWYPVQLRQLQRISWRLHAIRSFAALPTMIVAGLFVAWIHGHPLMSGFRVATISASVWIALQPIFLVVRYGRQFPIGLGSVAVWIIGIPIGLLSIFVVMAFIGLLFYSWFSGLCTLATTFLFGQCLALWLRFRFDRRIFDLIT